MLKEELKQISWLSITLDFWSNRKNQSFLCITGHWYTDSIDLVSKVIDFSLFENRHTGVEISKVIKAKLTALNVYDKIICITTDGAENMVLACELLDGNFTRIWCYAHRLHLVVTNAFGFWLPDKNIDSDFNVQASTGSRTIISTSASATISSISAPPTTSSTGAFSTMNTTTASLSTNVTTAAKKTELLGSASFDDDDGENEHMDIYDSLNFALKTSMFSHFVHQFM